MTVLPWVCAGSLGAYVVLLCLKVVAAHRRISLDKTPVRTERVAAGVTILQPILGGDPTLKECLSTNLRQTGPGTQFLWLIDEQDTTGIRDTSAVLEEAALSDPAILERVRTALYPEPPPGVNPKSFKLAQGLALVQSELVAVLDDDTTIDTEHLVRANAALERADLYTGLPAYRSGPGIGSRLIEGFVNASSAITYLPAALAGPAITLNGMFYVTRTEELRALGGFESISAELCDDLALARLYLRSGKVIHQGWTTQILRTEGAGLRTYWKKMHRWFVFMSVLVRTSSASQRLALGAAMSLGPPLLWAGILAGISGWISGAAQGSWVAAGVGATLLARHLALDGLLARASRGRARVPVFASLAAELLLPLHALHALLVPRIQWRSRAMQVHRDGTFTTADRGEARP